VGVGPMAAIALELVPIPATPGRYQAMLGAVEVCRSRQPLLDAARVLLAEGWPHETVLTTRHQGSDIVAQRSTVGEAAKWTVHESDRRGLQRRLWETPPMASRGERGGGEIERDDEGRGILPPEPSPPFSGAPHHPSDDFAPHAKRARG
jgi:hypothetical protein